METISWTSEQFDQVLLASGRGKDYLPALREFPMAIRLGTQMHGVLNGLRLATAKDGYERWAMIGVDQSTYVLHTSEFVKGENDQIPGNLRKHERGQADHAGINLVAEIHSHPTKHLSKYLGLPIETYSRFISYFNQFSNADIYNVLVEEEFLTASFLVVGQKNLFIMRTLESNSKTLKPFILSQESFVDYWEKYSWEHPEILLEPYGLNIAIARRHDIVLYAGEENEELMRVHPPI